MKIASFPSGSRHGVARSVCVLFIAPFLVTCSGSTEPLVAFWEGNLTPIPPSFVDGQVVAVTQHGKTDVGITIGSGEAGVAYGWRIDSGSCQENGVILGGPAAYPPLLPGQGGSASAETSLSALFKAGRHFSGRVFRSADGGLEQVVACGELEETTG